MLESEDAEYYNHTKFSEPCNNEEELVRQLSNEIEIPRNQLEVEERRIGAGYVRPQVLLYLGGGGS